MNANKSRIKPLVIPFLALLVIGYVGDAEAGPTVIIEQACGKDCGEVVVRIVGGYTPAELDERTTSCLLCSYNSVSHHYAGATDDEAAETAEATKLLKRVKWIVRAVPSSDSGFRYPDGEGASWGSILNPTSPKKEPKVSTPPPERRAAPIHQPSPVTQAPEDDDGWGCGISTTSNSTSTGFILGIFCLLFGLAIRSRRRTP